jgi:hypothetical protein
MESQERKLQQQAWTLDRCLQIELPSWLWAPPKEVVPQGTSPGQAIATLPHVPANLLSHVPTFRHCTSFGRAFLSFLFLALCQIGHKSMMSFYCRILALAVGEFMNVLKLAGISNPHPFLQHQQLQQPIVQRSCAEHRTSDA